MTPQETPKRAQAVDAVLLAPPPAVDVVAPPFANQVRAVGRPDGLVLHFYYVSPTQVASFQSGKEIEGFQLDESGSVLRIETTPVARVAISLTTMTDLLGLLAQNAAAAGPMVGSTLDELSMLIRGLGGGSVTPQDPGQVP